MYYENMKKFISILFTLFVVFSVHAQSADVITDILESEQATFGQVCYISAVEQGLIGDNDDYNKAIEVLAANELIPEIVDANTPMPVGNIAFLMSQIWDVKGGIMYRITKGSPRYSFKQFKTDGVIASTVEPQDFISGPELLEIHNICTRVYGGFNIRNVSMESE